jgi:antitoxin ParD1/3/4
VRAAGFSRLGLVGWFSGGRLSSNGTSRYNSSIVLTRLFMSINLTPEQESLIQTKLQTGKYRSAEEVIEIALQLLEDRDRADAEWLESVREKIDDAIAVSDSTEPIDGETFVNQILERFQPAHQTQA